jgi:hypothetical protein
MNKDLINDNNITNYNWIKIFKKNLDEIKILLNNEYIEDTFGENIWILTGSAAILYLLLNIYDEKIILKNYTMIPSDIDILVCSQKLINIKKLGVFNKVQETPNKSSTFIRNIINKDNIINKFDITVLDNVSYIIINDINVIDPKILLKNYEIDLDTPERDKFKDKFKMDILKYLIDNKKINNKVNKCNSKKKYKIDNIDQLLNVSKKLEF